MSEADGQAPPLEPLDSSRSWRTLVRNFAALALGEAGARLLGFIALVLLARRLGPHGFGLVTVGATLVVWFALIVDSGTEVLTSIDISRRPERFKEIAEPILGLRLALSLAAMALMALAAVVAAPDPADRVVLWLFALSLPLIALNLRWMVLGVGASKAVGAGNAGGELLFVIGIVLLVTDAHSSVRTVPLLEGAAELVYAGVVMVATVRLFGRLRPRAAVSLWRRTLRASLPLMANQLARAVAYSFDLFVVAVLVSRGAAGLYAVAHRPILFLSGLIGLLYISFLSSYSAASVEHAARLFRRTAIATTVAAIAVALAFTAGAGLFIGVFFGEAYEPARLPLTILVWGITVRALGGAYSAVLMAHDRQRVLMRNNLMGAGFNVVANLIAVPAYGIAGAALATVASEVLAMTLTYRSAAGLGLAAPLIELLRPGRKVGAASPGREPSP